MNYSQEILDFWEKVKAETGIKGDFVDAWGFGDNPDLIDELLGLVKQGSKRASTSLIKEAEVEGWPDPNVGDYNIVLDGRNKPVLVIKTVSVRQVKYKEVNGEHAYWEGEGDGTLETYFKEHNRYYKRRGEALGFEFSRDMEVILNRFEVVYPKEYADVS